MLIMNKAKIIVLIALIVLVLSIFGYLIFETFKVFGFWTLALSMVVNFLSTFVLFHFIGSRDDSNGVITYNPKEWPKFLSMSVTMVIGYYLYVQLNDKILSDYEYYYGMAYLIFLTALPIVLMVFRLIRDRNDFIKLSETTLMYKDNNEVGEYRYEDIFEYKVEGGILLKFKDDTTVLIKTSQMNFNRIDIANLIKDLNVKLRIH